MRRIFAAALSAFRLDRIGGREGRGGAAGLAPPSRAVGTAAAVAFAASLGAQLTVWLILAVGPLAEPFDPAGLTAMGRKNLRPEHDLPAFYAGCLASVALVWLCVRAFEARIGGRAGPGAARAARHAAWVHGALAFAGLAAFAALAQAAGSEVGPDARLPAAALARLALPALASVAALAVDHHMARRAARSAETPPEPAASAEPSISSEPAASAEPSMSSEPAAPPRRRAGLALDAFLVLVLLSLVFVPLGAHLAGAVFANELFFHWDHFALGPALAWRHGLALGTEVYSQYGAGWPVVLNALAPLAGFGHQSAVVLAMLYGCVYHAGLYVLLRVVTRSRALAFGGTLGILAASLFSPLVAAEPKLSTIWQWPSLSIVRAPVDVWLLLVLWLHARRPTRARMVAAGALAGLALWLETDTGIFAVGVLAVYGACRFVAAELGSPIPREPGRPGVTVAATVVAFAAVLLPGLALASHGALWSEPGAFLSGWIGGVANSSARGVGASAFGHFLARHGDALVPALAILAVGLYAVGDTLARLLQGRATPTTVLTGCVGLYALGRLTLFVWRTVPIRLTLVAVPVGILAVVALASLRGPVAARLSAATGVGPRRLEPIVPLAALLLGAGLLLASPGFHAYPNLWRLARTGLPERGLVLFPERGEIAGIPRDRAPMVAAVRAAVAEVRRLEAPVAVLDPIQTLVYVAADERPWPGEAGMFLNTWTDEDLARLTARLAREGPPHVLLRRTPPSPAVEDTWRALARTTEAHYAPGPPIGVFQRWDRR